MPLTNFIGKFMCYTKFWIKLADPIEQKGTQYFKYCPLDHQLFIYTAQNLFNYLW